MGCLASAARALGVVVSAWLVLVVMYVTPCLLPARWQYYIYSPASAGLWMLSMIFVPAVLCVLLRRWIASGTQPKPDARREPATVERPR